MASSLRIYHTQITPQRNMLIEDIQDYLLSMYDAEETLTINDIQYQKIRLDGMLKIEADQSKVGLNKIGNYCDLYQDGFHYYFFVLKAEWLSKSCIGLSVSLDTINTFQSLIQFGKKTEIIREHKDRYEFHQDSNSYYALISKTDEGINPVLYKREIGLVRDLTNDYDWFLIYRNSQLNPDDNDNVVDCFVVASEPIDVHGFSTNNYSFIPADLTANEYVVLADDNIDGIFRYKDKDGSWNYDYIRNTNRKAHGICYNVAFKKKDNAIQVKIGRASDNYSKFTQLFPIKTIDGVQEIQFINCNTYYRTTLTNITGNSNISTIRSGTLTIFVNTINTTGKFDDIDRTDSQIIKIIQLPYLPCSLTSDNFEFDTTIEGYETILKLKNINAKFNYNVIDDVNDPAWRDAILFNFTPSTNDLRQNQDTKLLHSSYYQPKFIYDSFSYIFQLENFEFESLLDRDDYSYFTFNFVPSNTITSAFLFEFSQLTYNTSQVDYDNILIVSRNNEVVLYNSSYINYIKNGFNYDKTTLNEQNKMNWVGTAFSVVAAVAGSLVGGPVGLAATIAAVLSTSKSIITNIESQANGERAIQNKLQQAQAQSVSVSGNNAVDLLNHYSKNRAKIVIYEPSQIMKQHLDDLFYYCGYAGGYSGIPNINSRYWFNFLQCNPDLIDQTSEITSPVQIYHNYKQDIISRFQAGITIFHHHSIWDINQEKENWENSILS